ncbi:MAG: methyltransferase domain-containing protein [Deltaproteobacteria bacterium]|nr:MAG: methyltransferase domain-containing protein [Deltaproteobacteria bacterium]
MRSQVLWFYEQLYTKLAWSYGPVTRLASGGLWYQWTFVAERYLAGPPVLDVGCGLGKLVGRLFGRGYQVTGVDRSPQMIRAAKKRLQQAGLHVPLIRAEGKKLPFTDASFGTLITTFPASFAYDSSVQGEFARVLHSGGRWVWVDAPFAHRRTLRMVMFAMLSYGAGLQSSVFRPTNKRPLSSILKTKSLTGRELAWHPRLDPALFFDVTIEQVPVGETFVHVAVLEKRGRNIT